MEKRMNTVVEYEFYDGTTVKMTLTFYALYQLKSKNKALYDRYNKIMSTKNSDELDMITVLYVAYVCANDGEDLMTEEEFLFKCGSDRIALKDAVEQLLQPKKQ